MIQLQAYQSQTRLSVALGSFAHLNELFLIERFVSDELVTLGSLSGKAM